MKRVPFDFAGTLREVALALCTSNNCVATDDPDAVPDEKSWRIDNSAELRALADMAEALREARLALPTLSEESAQPQTSKSLPTSESDPLPSAKASRCGRRPENHDRPTLAAELLLRKAGLLHLGSFDRLEDRLLWLVRSDKGLAFLCSREWPPAFLRPQQPEERNESNLGRVSCGGDSTTETLPVQEPEDLLANALYLLQLCQQDMNMGRPATVWPRAKRARELCQRLEKMFGPTNGRNGNDGSNGAGGTPTVPVGEL